jgi:hypothetical protein
MELPYDLDLDELLSILILRVLGYSEDKTASTLHCGKAKVVAGERWFREANYNTVLVVCDQQAIKRVTARELASCEEIDGQTLVKAAQLTTNDMLRHYHADYLPNVELPTPGFDKHYRDLAEVAKTLHDVQQFILSYQEGETFTVIESPSILGFFFFQPPPKKQPLLPSFTGSSVSVDCPAVEYFFEHLRQEFAELNSKEWRELVKSKLPKHVIERFGYLGNTAKFKYCPTCQVCKDLMA